MSEEAVAPDSTASTDELATAATDALRRVRELLDAVPTTTSRLHDLRNEVAKEAEDAVAQLSELRALHEEVPSAAESVSTTIEHATMAGAAFRALSAATDEASHATAEMQRSADGEISGFAEAVGGVDDDLASSVEALEQEGAALGARAVEVANTLRSAADATIEAVQNGLVTETDTFEAELTERVERLSRFLLEEAEAALGVGVEQLLANIEAASGLLEQAMADIATETAGAAEESLQHASAHQDEALHQIESLSADIEAFIDTRVTLGSDAKDEIKDETDEIQTGASRLRGALAATLSLIKDVQSTLHRYSFVRF
jgi:hypothetical protein